MIRAILIGLVAGLIVMVTSGCGTVAPRAVLAHAIAFDKNSANAGIIDCSANGCIVTSGFMAKYHQLENEFKKSSPADSYVKPEGAHYRVSYQLIEHFTQLKAAERGSP